MKSKRFFPHHCLGYRSNPFGALVAEEWTAVAFLPAAVRQAFSGNWSHLQLLGPAGCGKTTTLLKLCQQFRQSGRRAVYEYLPEGQTHFATDLRGVTFFALDEAQRLSWRQRRRWLQAATAVTFIFSSHRDLSPHFARKNLRLKTVRIDKAISADTYKTWIDKRLDYFALPHLPQLRLTDDAIAWLAGRFGTALREAEYFMYEVFQQEWEQPLVEVADLEKISGGRRP